MSGNKKSGWHSRECWVALVGEFEQSGLSQHDFCEGQGVRESDFRYWLYRLRRKDAKGQMPKWRFV